MDNLQNTTMIPAETVFSERFLKTQSLYLYCFKQLPSLHFINNIDGEKAYKTFKETFAHLIEGEHQYCWFDGRKKRYGFGETIFILKNKCLVELKDYCEILHDGTQDAFVKECTDLMNRFHEKGKRK